MLGSKKSHLGANGILTKSMLLNLCCWTLRVLSPCLWNVLCAHKSLRQVKMSSNIFEHLLKEKYYPWMRAIESRVLSKKGGWNWELRKVLTARPRSLDNTYRFWAGKDWRGCFVQDDCSSSGGGELERDRKGSRLEIVFWWTFVGNEFRSFKE